MKSFMSVLGVALAGKEVPGQNGWHVGCRVPARNPAFAFIDEGDLYFTAFQVTGNDHVYRIRDFDGSEAGCDSNVVETVFDGIFPWPNAVQRVPDEIMNDGNKWYSVAAGFFPGNKNDGCVAFFNGELDAAETADSAIFMTPGCDTEQAEHDRFFYHKIAWADMDNDGDLDMITARVINDGPITPLDQDLLWFENDGVPQSREQWKMHRIVAENHADVFFSATQLPRINGEGTQTVIAVGSFYAQRLELVWTEDPNDNWKNTDLQKSVLIDTAGWYFDVHFHDMTMNGKKDMFASTWSRNGEYGQTMGYEMIGADWREPSSWSFNSVFNRFPQFANAGFGSPGGFSIARLGENDSNLKEHIFVSGDDDGQLYVQTPLSDTSWRYETTSIYMTDDNVGFLTLTGATIGEVTAGEFTGDSTTDVLIPNYTRNEIIILEQDEA